MLRLNSLMHRIMICILLLIILSGPTTGFQRDTPWIHDVYHVGDFELAERTRASDIVVSAEDFRVVQIAAENLAEDVQRVTGKKPAMRTRH